jgi:uncharacterized protein YndB with AHSA1/START domain
MGATMSFDIHHHIEIAAPIQTVWHVTTDVAAWPDRFPTIEAARLEDEGELGQGSRFVLNQPWQARKTWRVTRLDPPTLAVWRTDEHGPTMVATHQLSAAGSGCISRLSLTVNGGAVLQLLRPVLWFALHAENRALKKWCERGC